VTFLWLIAQFKAEAITEAIEADPLNDEFVYKTPYLVARAMRAIYGSRAEEIVEQQRMKTDEFHAAKWQRIREELSRPA
jgi:hypothetical protein